MPCRFRGLCVDGETAAQVEEALGRINAKVEERDLAGATEPLGAWLHSWLPLVSVL